MEQLLSQSYYQKVIAMSFPSVAEDLEQWSKESYEKNPIPLRMRPGA